MRPGGACTACPGFSLSLHRPRRDDGRRNRAQEPQPPRVQAVPYTHAHSRHRGRTEPRNRARVQGHRQAPKQATEPPTEGAQAQAIHSPGNNTAGNAHKCPTEPPRAGVLSLYYQPPKRPTAAHRAAHRGQAAGGTETPGRASPQPPQPRHSTPGENPGGFL